MSIYIGTTEPDQIYIGENPVNEVYVGTTKVRPSGSTPVIPTDGLLGHRALQSDLSDSSGNGHDGTWFDSSLAKNFVTIGGKTGAYVTRWNDGYSWLSSQHVVAGLSYSGPNITVCGWVYFDDFHTSGIRPGPATNATGGTSYISLSARPSQNHIFAGGTSGGVINSQTIPTTGVWYFVALSVGNTGKKIYVDGVLEGQNSTSSTQSFGGTWRFGCCQSGSAGSPNAYGGMEGYVRHWAVYNRILSDQEISDFYNATN